MPLTETAIRIAKAEPKPYKISDSGGMYLLVHPNGSKYFRYDYRFAGKRRTAAIGVYPDLSLKQARVERDRIKSLLSSGFDPSVHSKPQELPEVLTFEMVAREWHLKQRSRWTERYALRLISLFERDLFPYLGKQGIDDIKAPELLKVLRKMEARGLTESVGRARELAGSVFRYGIACGYCDRDVSSDLRGALATTPVKHRAAIIDPEKFGKLLRDLDNYKGSFVVSCGLRLSPLLALRPGELRHLEWTEVNVSAKEIRIPGSKMKMRTDHIVPLSRQALNILETLRPATGDGQYVFPSMRHPRGDRPMSENTVNVAIRSLGYDNTEMCAHGFRGSFCSLANEKLGFSTDAIERQLAHAERNKVRAAYLHAEFLAERRKLMQAWADLMEDFKTGKGPRHKKTARG
jgi:integrase